MGVLDLCSSPSGTLETGLTTPAWKNTQIYATCKKQLISIETNSRLAEFLTQTIPPSVYFVLSLLVLIISNPDVRHTPHSLNVQAKNKPRIFRTNLLLILKS